MKKAKVTAGAKILLVLATLTLSVRGFEVQLYECACSNDLNCNNDDDSKGNQSSFWKTFPYETSHNQMENGTIRLIKQNERFACHPSNLSENIVIDLFDADNKDAVEGELHGTLLKNNEYVSLQLGSDRVLTLFATDTGAIQFNSESFCIRRLNTSHSSLEICCGNNHKSCIRKCCPYGYVFTNNYENPCVLASHDEAWTLPMMVPLTSLSSSKMELSRMKIRTGFPKCEATPAYNIAATLSSALTKFNLPRLPFRLYQDGSVKYLGSEAGSKGLKWIEKVEHVDYCVDTISVPQDMTDLTCGLDEQDVLIMCSKPHVKNFTRNDWVWIYRIIYMVGFGISIFFLLITAVVHFLLWEKQNIHAWTILCYVISLTGFYICLLIIYVEETRKRLYLGTDEFTPLISNGWCYALGLVAHFMGVFAFSWLSVINFDLWWTFRVLKPMNQRNFDCKRLVCYGSFATAVPTTVVSVAVALQLSHDTGSELCRKTEEDHTIYPMYGQESCFLANSAQPYYFYLPVGFLLLANFIFYLCTSCQMLRIYNATRSISDRNSKKQKQSCELFFKLFLVMGTTWIFQVILSVVESDETVSKWYFILYTILDLTNMFQAIAIFVIFVCKRETMRALEQKYLCLKSCLHPVRGFYQTHPTALTSRSTDGSTKMSRTELTKHLSIESYSSGCGVGDHRRDSELIIFS